MRGNLVSEIVIPARHGRAVIVKKGQVLRIQPLEDGQVGDCVFYNANDYKEWFHVGQSWAINVLFKTGTARSFKYFYSKPPRENIMLTTLEDTIKNHWGNSGARCSRRFNEMWGHPSDHRSCQENLAEALAPYGLTGDDVMDIFNLFMGVDLRPDGSFALTPSPVTKEDYIDLRAEMDVLAAISACPAESSAKNRSPTNHGRCSPLIAKIFEA